MSKIQCRNVSLSSLFNGLSRISVIALSSYSLTVSANGFLENRAWQFDTPSDKIAKSTMLDLMEKKDGGYYDSFDVYNNYITNVAGDQVNCNLSANAIGNTGNNAASGSASSPGIETPGSISADALGNQGSNSTSGSRPSILDDGDNLVDASSTLNDSATGSANSVSHGSTGTDSLFGQAGQLINSSQGNSNSPQNANVDNASVNTSIDGMNASGGVSDVALNSSMANTDSPQTATVNDSDACRLYRGE
jgi:hypothetical protein